MTLHSLVDPEQAPAAPKAGPPPKKLIKKPPPKKLIKKPPPKGFYQDSSEDEVASESVAELWEALVAGS